MNKQKASEHTPLVSIIVPVYNSEKYIRDTIISCLEQSYQAIELILINDGSKDNSEAIIQSFSDPRITYYSIKNSGPCYARNYGMQRANGSLFQFLDADDILDPHKPTEQVKLYQQHGPDYIYSGVMGHIIADKKQLEQGFEFYYRNLDVVTYFREMFGHFGKYYTTGMWLVPRNLLEKTHGWDDKVLINNDGEYFARVILQSRGVIFCPGAVFYYRRDVPMSVSKRFVSKNIYESWLYSYSCYVKQFQQALDPKTAGELGRKALSVYYCNSYPFFPDLLQDCKNQIQQLGYRKPVAYGGKTFRLLSKVVGVNNALRLKTIKQKATAGNKAANIGDS